MNLLTQEPFKRLYLKHIPQGNITRFSVLEFDLSPDIFTGNRIQLRAKVLKNGRVFDTANHALEYIKKYVKASKIALTPYWAETLKNVDTSNKSIVKRYRVNRG